MNAILRKAMAQDHAMLGASFSRDSSNRQFSIWWPASTSGSQSAWVYSVKIAANQSEQRGLSAAMHGLVMREEDTMSFTVLEAAIPAAAPIRNDIVFHAGHTVANRRKYRVTKHTSQLGLLTIDAVLIK